MREPSRKTFRNFWAEEQGIGTVEIILLLFVIIGLILIFKKQITALVENIFDSITSESDEVLGG